MSLQKHLKNLVSFCPIKELTQKGLTSNSLKNHQSSAEYLYKELIRLGCKTFKIVTPLQTSCVIGVLGTGSDTLIYNGHYDVVNVPGWNAQKYISKNISLAKSLPPDKIKQLEIKQIDTKTPIQLIFGQGASDMNGANAAMLKAIEDINIPKNCRLIVTFVPDEEDGGEFGTLVMMNYLLKKQIIKPNQTNVIIGEASHLRMVTKRRAMHRISIRFHKKQNIPPDTTFHISLENSMHNALFDRHTDEHVLKLAIQNNQERRKAGLMPILLYCGVLKESQIIPSDANVTPTDIRIGYAKTKIYTAEAQLLDFYERFNKTILEPFSESIYCPNSNGIAYGCNRIISKKSEIILTIDLRAFIDDQSYILGKFQQLLKGLDAEIINHRYDPSLETSQSIFVANCASIIKKSLENCTLYSDQFTSKGENPGQSDSRFFIEKGISNIFEFGPVGYNEHGKNEFVILNTLRKVQDIYTLLISNPNSYVR